MGSFDFSCRAEGWGHRGTNLSSHTNRAERTPTWSLSRVATSDPHPRLQRARHQVLGRAPRVSRPFAESEPTVWLWSHALVVVRMLLLSSARFCVHPELADNTQDAIPAAPTDQDAGGGDRRRYRLRATSTERRLDARSHPRGYEGQP